MVVRVCRIFALFGHVGLLATTGNACMMYAAASAPSRLKCMRRMCKSSCLLQGVYGQLSWEALFVFIASIVRRRRCTHSSSMFCESSCVHPYTHCKPPGNVKLQGSCCCMMLESSCVRPFTDCKPPGIARPAACTVNSN